MDENVRFRYMETGVLGKVATDSCGRTQLLFKMAFGERRNERRRLRVAFVHPDLGLGGAERLVVDSALGLDELGHSCKIYTPFLDRNRAFSEVIHGKVRSKVVLTPIPRAVFGRLHAICAAVRCAFVALYIAIVERPDVAIVDIVTLPCVVFAFYGIPTLFYCHYPDALLAKTLDINQERPSKLRVMYRYLVDKIEAMSLNCSKRVAVNSNFTATAYKQAFPNGSKPVVIYPCTEIIVEEEERKLNQPPFMLSLNRYERKKNIALAIGTLASTRGINLVIAGGWDERVRENVEHFQELVNLGKERGVFDRIQFLKNVSHEKRTQLLKDASCVLYTPANEHFGIVPIEAMAMGTPVIAVNSGGPKESVVHGSTGLLCEATVEEFGRAVAELLGDKPLAIKMGENGKNWIKEKFSRRTMATEMELILRSICGN